MLIKYNSENDQIQWRDNRVSKDIALEKLCSDGTIKTIWYEGQVPEIVHKDNLITVFKYNEVDGLYLDYEPMVENEYDENQELMQYLSDIELSILELSSKLQKESV